MATVGIAAACIARKDVPVSELPDAIKVGQRYEIATADEVYDGRVTDMTDEYVELLPKTTADRVTIEWEEIVAVRRKGASTVTKIGAWTVGAAALVGVVCYGLTPFIGCASAAPPEPGHPPSNPVRD